MFRYILYCICSDRPLLATMFEDKANEWLAEIQREHPEHAKYFYIHENTNG